MTDVCPQCLSTELRRIDHALRVEDTLSTASAWRVAALQDHILDFGLGHPGGVPVTV